MRILAQTRLFLLVFFAFFGAVAQAETLVGSNVDSRMLIGFKVNADAMQSRVPEGWASIPFPGGPLKGANLLAVLIDRKLERDAEGKPKSPSTSRAMALIGLGKQIGGDGVRLYVYRIYATPQDYDPYGNAVQAGISRTTSTEGPANAGRARTEVWTVAPQGGGELGISARFTSGTRSWVSDEARPYSNMNPDFFRIYRYDQLVDLVTSTPVGKPLTGTFDFSSTVAELADVFDGSQEVVAIMDVPVYVREIYLP